MSEEYKRLKGIIELEVLDLINRPLQCEIKQINGFGSDNLEITITGHALGTPFILITSPCFDYINSKDGDKYMYCIAREVGMKLIQFIYDQRSTRYEL